LLAVTPEITGQWTWAKLEGILNDTLERTKQRAVEPDLLGSTAFGHLLPAVLSAVTSRRFRSDHDRFGLYDGNAGIVLKGMRMPQIPISPATKALFLSEVFFSSIPTWNRLGGRPRSYDFDRSLRAEVRDPLWMLCRQWQFGEFDGEDAGSAVTAKTQVATAQVNRFAGRDAPAIAYDERLPLETRVEREPIPLDLLTSAQMGRHWLKLIAGTGDFKAMYLRRICRNFL
jgi:hypothetical protein